MKPFLTSVLGNCFPFYFCPPAVFIIDQVSRLFFLLVIVFWPIHPLYIDSHFLAFFTSIFCLQNSLKPLIFSFHFNFLFQVSYLFLYHYKANKNAIYTFLPSIVSSSSQLLSCLAPQISWPGFSSGILTWKGSSSGCFRHTMSLQPSPWALRTKWPLGTSVER